MGGKTAMMFSSMYPELIKKLIAETRKLPYKELDFQKYTLQIKTFLLLLPSK